MMSDHEVTAAQCDAAREAALTCDHNSVVTYMTLCVVAKSNPDLLTPKQLAEMREFLRRSLDEFDSAWTHAVSSWFYRSRPIQSARFGEELTACEFARGKCADAFVAVETALEGDAECLDRAREYFGPIDAGNKSGLAIPSSINAEWSAASAALITTPTFNESISREDLDSDSIHWHTQGDTKPDIYKFGPLTGTKAKLAQWTGRGNYARALNRPLKNGTFWGRFILKGDSELWFKSQDVFAKANAAKLADERVARA